MINQQIIQLVRYGIHHQLIEQEDYDYSINKLCDLLKYDHFSETEVSTSTWEEPSRLLEPLLDFAVAQKIIEHDTILSRDIFEAKIMDLFVKRPSDIEKTFYEKYQSNPIEATSYFYNLSKKSNYIKTSRISKNIDLQGPTSYGTLKMTINLSKPEKDPLDIIKMKNHISTDYPLCVLCKEQVGLSQSPGRTNHRIIPVLLNDELFYIQYSPYVYYNEHCIVLKKEHEPMHVCRKTFQRLLDFVDKFPHYLLGSNAGLPIVGGSILSHEHYQGGRDYFPIQDAQVLAEYNHGNIKISKLHWPINVIRLESTNKDNLIDTVNKLFMYWKDYSDRELGIIAQTDQPHNAITPIARKNNDKYIFDVALRNNRTTAEFPLGVFHPHPENHHIKKENIGLIEVMGLAVLPGRLDQEIPMIKDAILHQKPVDKEAIVHQQWVQSLQKIYNGEDINVFINNQLAIKFAKCLEDSAVFKQDTVSQEHYDSFIKNWIAFLD